MTLINALMKLKELGIQTVTSGNRVHSIDAYISNTEDVLTENNVNDNGRLLAMPDGNYIITDMILGFETVQCSTYSTDNEAESAFEAFQSRRKPLPMKWRQSALVNCPMPRGS